MNEFRLGWNETWHYSRILIDTEEDVTSPTAEQLRIARADAVKYLRKTLIGPVGCEHEIIQGSPVLRYMMGMLFPQQEPDKQEDDGTGGSEKVADEDFDRPLPTNNRNLPASVGISFLVSAGAMLRCVLSAAVYSNEVDRLTPDQVQLPREARRKPGRSRVRWTRIPLPSHGKSEVICVDPSKSCQVSVLEGRAMLHLRSRPWTDGHLITVTVVNANRSKGKTLNVPGMLFQIEMGAEVVSGQVRPYPQSPNAGTSGEEEAETRHLYRESPVFARGHGAAATWEVVDNTCRRVSIEFLPQVEVRAATFELEASMGIDPRCCDLSFLGSTQTPGEVQTVLGGLAKEFSNWVDREEALSGAVPAAARLAAKCRQWHARIKHGIDLLSNGDTFEAFRLANCAMGWQMQMAQNARGGPFPASAKRSPPGPPLGTEGLRWRPFQIAFFLAMLPSLVAGDDGQYIDRDEVDVIWFPTGGGKTEAYLLIAAFELLRRRFCHGECETATAVLSRYTLRMLTAQQFQRTAVLVCALELMRRQDKRLGSRPFTLGLWVGGGHSGLTPNTMREAAEQFERWKDGPPGMRNPFLVNQCPACGTEIVDRENRQVGMICDEQKFQLLCLSSACNFNSWLPLQVVDEMLYREPPSVLLGTLDKFAALPWSDLPRVFFGGPDDKGPPPSLIIQDELHLISGTLGSLCGPYELAIDAIIRSRNGGRMGAKIVASTATIRNSREQLKGLYARGSSVFPCPVRTWDDAFFFSLEDPSAKPGRLYVGAMGQGTTTPVVSLVWAVAALLQLPEEVELPASLDDAYRTVLAYHNSRRELGRTITSASQEIPDRMKAIATAQDGVRAINDVMELSSQMSKDIGYAIHELERCGTANRAAVDLVPCTSIVSVGIDVDRLGIMLVNGQPKLTAEYIQASSRIGRSREAPGLVFTLFSPVKPRDRSHYEDFRAYHESFYRFVEPTSVTPYAPPARERTLHAGLIAMIRHATPHRANRDAGSVDFTDTHVASLVLRYVNSIRMADPAEADAANEQLQEFIAEWIALAESGADTYFASPGRQFQNALIRDYDDPPSSGLKPTMRSVRNVEPDIYLSPVGRG